MKNDSKQVSKLTKKTVLVLISIMWLAACGGQQEKANESAPNASTTPEYTASGAIKLVINSDDLMRFDKEELRVTAGSDVELTLNHTGKLAKAVMGHNVVILKLGTDVAAFAQKAIEAKENDYIPESDDILIHTALIGGGETTTITFEAPAKGSYEFLCSFPGHWGLMRGKFIVE
ncbi:MAG: azurin [Bacteroidota bacterium]